ncbi:MAG: peptidylprolyl isomerase [Bacilli bacterium]|nr:peptidylprolyl isomerase [Bacilli bacterium]
MKKIKTIILMLISIILLTGCQTKTEELLGINFDVEGNTSDEFNYDTDNPTVAMKIKGYGAIVIELYPNIAPNTVNNFIYLVKTGFYDNNTFHRLMPGFVLQGGDKEGTGAGGPGYHIQGEFTSNNFKNDLKHTKGIVSMARATLPNSAGSQFFIMLGSATHLDGQYAAFGKVIDGMNIIEKIEKKEKIADKESGKLATNLVLEKALVNTKNIDYPEPEKN